MPSVQKTGGFCFPLLFGSYPLGILTALCQYVDMVCIYCGRSTEVTNSRKPARTPSVWRRRACQACVAQFTTIELPDYSTALAVKDRDGKLEPFVRDKLFLSLHKSLGHRPDAQKAATELTTSVIAQLLRKKRAKDGLIEAKVLAETANIVLKRYDAPSAHTYRAYHASALRPATS